jgi:hypothetical protein
MKASLIFVAAMLSALTGCHPEPQRSPMDDKQAVDKADAAREKAEKEAEERSQREAHRQQAIDATERGQHNSN